MYSTASSSTSMDNSRARVSEILERDVRTGTSTPYDCMYLSRMLLLCRYLLVLLLNVDKDEVNFVQVDSLNPSV